MVSAFQRQNDFECALLGIVLSVWANLSRRIGEPTMTVSVEESNVFIAAAAEEILFVLPSLNGGHNGLTTTPCAQS